MKVVPPIVNADCCSDMDMLVGGEANDAVPVDRAEPEGKRMFHFLFMGKVPCYGCIFKV
jgi:hypothetical protein